MQYAAGPVKYVNVTPWGFATQVSRMTVASWLDQDLANIASTIDSYVYKGKDGLTSLADYRAQMSTAVRSYISTYKDGDLLLDGSTVEQIAQDAYDKRVNMMKLTPAPFGKPGSVYDYFLAIDYQPGVSQPMVPTNVGPKSVDTTIIGNGLTTGVTERPGVTVTGLVSAQQMSAYLMASTGQVQARPGEWQQVLNALVPGGFSNPGLFGFDPGQLMVASQYWQAVKDAEATYQRMASATAAPAANPAAAGVGGGPISGGAPTAETPASGIANAISGTPPSHLVLIVIAVAALAWVAK